MILKIVLNLYLTVEKVLKQLISSFDTALAWMLKGKPSSTKSLVSTMRFWQKVKTALFILSLVKPRCRFSWLGVTSLPRERFNISCFYARTKKKHSKRLRNQNYELGTRKLQELQNWRLRMRKFFIEIAKSRNMNSK